jgi:soluble lytic murein transglycosylase
MKLVCALLFLALPSTDRDGLILKQRHEQILRYLEAEGLAQAETALGELRRVAPQTFTRNSYDYLLGRVSQKLGKMDAARVEYLKVVERDALVSEYALWHLTEIARAAGEFEAERQHLEKILGGFPESLLADRSRWRLAESYFESEEYPRAISLYAQIARGRGSRAREAQLKIGQAELSQGQAVHARATLEKLLTPRSRDDTALAAVRLLDDIDHRTGAALSVTDHLQRARIYQANRAFDAARRHYQWIIEHLPGHQAVPEALFEIGLGYYRQDNYDQTIVWYERVHDQFPQTKEGEQGFYQVGHAHARAGRWLQAVERYEKFIAAYPQSEFLSGAHLNAIDALRSAGMNGEALAWCRRTIQRFPGELAATTALFSQARIHLAQNNYQAALTTFDELLQQNLNRPGPRAPNRPEVTFMRGYCLEKLGKYAEAIAVYLSLPPERENYYGYRATARLHGLIENPEAKKLVRAQFQLVRQQAQSARADRRYLQAVDALRQAWRLTTDKTETTCLMEQLKQIYPHLPQYKPWSELQLQDLSRNFLSSQSPPRLRSHRTLASELLFLGLYDEGAPELAAALEPTASRLSQSQLYSLAVLLNRGGYPGEALRIGESHFASRIPKDYCLELLPAQLAQTLYPMPYANLLNRHARERHLDPRFVLAIIRQESRFRAEAKSPAAARGLMQFIPSTAERLATEMGKSELNVDDLYDPETSIQLGTFHLEELARAFPQHLPAVAAAYNGGADNAERWLDRAQSADPDRFVIELAFHETKQYVYRVMADYWAYQQILTPADQPR